MCCLEVFRKKVPSTSEFYVPTEKCQSHLGVECTASDHINLIPLRDELPEGEAPPSYSPPRVVPYPSATNELPGGVPYRRYNAVRDGEGAYGPYRAARNHDDIRLSTVNVTDCPPQNNGIMLDVAAPPKCKIMDTVVQELGANQKQFGSKPSSGTQLSSSRAELIIDRNNGCTYRKGILLGKVIFFSYFITVSERYLLISNVGDNNFQKFGQSFWETFVVIFRLIYNGPGCLKCLMMKNK